MVGGGLDVVYPATSRRVWEAVATSGALCSEAALGAPPAAWRFPLRNRMLAALAHVVVVVESHRGGGALHTVGAADDRSIPVMAVPGSVRSRASDGTNALIADGCAVARDASDVLALLGLVLAGAPGRGRPAGDDHEAPTAPRPAVGLDAAATGVLGALDDLPVGFEVVCGRAGVGLAEGAAALDRLAAAGLARRSGAGWERVDPA